MEALELLAQIHRGKCWPSVDKISPCEEACPLHTDVPSYVIAITQGKFKEALAVIKQTNPFPSICGRVCHHPCEEECNRALVDRPVAIQWLKRVVADYELDGDVEKPAPVERTKREKIAIIGSGPAGLTAAYDLVRQGYGVAVYEASPVAGGMLATGIPDFILPKEIVQAEINYIKDLGVEIKTNTAISRDLTLDDLPKQGFKAMLLATGAQKSAELPIPGTDLENVVYALPLLQQVKLGDKVVLRGKVAVIGGGNVAMDAARVAVRLGAKEVHVACLELRRGMPAFAWEIEAAERDGVKIHPALAPQRFRARDGKRVAVIDFRRVASTQPDSEGRITWTLMEGPGTEYAMDVDAVIVAIGQIPDLSYADGAGLNISARRSFVVAPDTLATNVPGIFAAGDAVRMPGTVVESIAAGHEAATSIHRYLQGQDLREGRAPIAKEVLKIKPEMIPGFLIRKDRWEMASLVPQDAVRCFREVKLGYTQWQGIEEAKRCLNCRMCANCVFERGQICFETATRLL
jgi:NADPH-dependent glutamate synthase beta subunit-like oxidoreductase